MNANVLGSTTAIPNQDEAKPAGEKMARALRRGAVLLLVGGLIFLAWLVRTQKLYESGSDFGYNLGLIGGLLMVGLLIYPLRKRFGSYDRFGKMEFWFRYHMVAGIGGPLLVLFHSTFQTGSLNGAMALYSMLLVACSGVVGRFIYRHIHRGLYGQHLTLADTTEELKACADNLGSVFALRPDIEPRLTAFSEAAFDKSGSPPQRIWKFLLLRLRGRRLARAIRRDAKESLQKRWRTEGGTRRELVLNYQLARGQINRYLDAVVKASQLSVWEKLFSYWHLIHIPFLYLLVFSGVVHVVAVHMY